jgi:hypothetical protein
MERRSVMMIIISLDFAGEEHRDKEVLRGSLDTLPLSVVKKSTFK